MGGTTFYSFRDTLSTHTRAHTYIRIRNWPLNPCGIRASLLSVTFQSRWSFFFSFFTRAHVFVSPASRYILSRTNLCLTRALSKQLPALFYIFIAYTGTCAERNSQLRNLTTWFAYASIFFSSVTPPFLFSQTNISSLIPFLFRKISFISIEISSVCSSKKKLDA